MNNQIPNTPFIPFEQPQSIQNGSTMNQNITQIQCQSTYVMFPQQPYPQLHLPYAANQYTNGIFYYNQPYIMYSSQQQSYPVSQSYPITTYYPFENYPLNNQMEKQVNTLSSDENINPQSQNLSNQHTFEQTAQYNSKQINNANEEYNVYIKTKKIHNKIDNTIPINSTQDQKKSQQYDFLSFSSESMIHDKQMRSEQQAKTMIFKSNVILSPKQKYNDIMVKLQSTSQNLQENLETKESMKNNTIHIKKNQDNKQENNDNQQGQLIFNLSSNQIDLLKQLQGINIQNAFKNFLKGFKSHVNECFTHIYVYDYSQTEIQDDKDQEKQILRSGQENINVRMIENPTITEKKSFIQKFNKFIKNKKYNNTSIKQIIENKLYSNVLKDYIINNSSEWLKASNFQNKEDIIVVLQFFKMCCENQNLLLFLSKNKDKLIPLSSSPQ